ncbi:hypothetical protein GJ496_011085 [Pomphorhynchus laevis]|nr:hypothetical protein GJ496_011085 [Pomphorhynchus laevis]
MKSVMTAIWLLTNSVGNLITVIINSAVGDRSEEIWLFFVYAVLIVVVDGVFVLLVKSYIPREQRLKDTELMLSELETKKAEAQEPLENN